MVQTLEQERARFALEKINRWRINGQLQDGADSYTRLVQKFPAMVITNGLGQALAYLLADNEGKQKPSRKLYNDLGEWLVTRRIYQGPHDKLIDLLITGDRRTYQLATEETLALVTWMTKFAEAFLK